MTALTDSIDWVATPGASGYTVGVRDTTAPASQAGAYLYRAIVGPSATSVPISAIVYGGPMAPAGPDLPVGVLLAASVQATAATTNGIGDSIVSATSDWSAEVTFTLDEPASTPDDPAQSAGSVRGGKGSLGNAQTVDTPVLDAPSGVAIGSS